MFAHRYHPVAKQNCGERYHWSPYIHTFKIIWSTFSSLQGDQIGRIFAQWDCNSGQFLKITYRSIPHFMLLFLRLRISTKFSKKVLGYILGVFVTSSSGHSASLPGFPMSARLMMVPGCCLIFLKFIVTIEILRIPRSLSLLFFSPRSVRKNNVFVWFPYIQPQS
jgi:hypothetical protein